MAMNGPGAMSLTQINAIRVKGGKEALRLWACTLLLAAIHLMVAPIWRATLGSGATTGMMARSTKIVQASLLQIPMAHKTVLIVFCAVARSSTAIGTFAVHSAGGTSRMTG